MLARPLVLVLALSNAPLVRALADENVDFFEKKVRPLLEQRCLECHGAKKVKGGLRLDSRDGWRAGGDSGPAIEPGKPGESLFVRAIGYSDTELQMPPKKKLAAEEVAIFEEW